MDNSTFFGKIYVKPAGGQRGSCRKRARVTGVNNDSTWCGIDAYTKRAKVVLEYNEIFYHPNFYMRLKVLLLVEHTHPTLNLCFTTVSKRGTARVL